MFPPLGHLKTSAVAFIVIIGRCASLLPDFVPTWVGSPPPPRRNQWVSLKKAPRITISNVSTGQLFRLLLLYQPANPRPTRQNTDNSPLRANSQSAESQHEDTRQNTTRRKFMQSSFFVLQCTITLHGKLIPEADARGLVQFPCKNGLMNNYIFMRSGQSLLEEENVFNTNPLFLTNRENALSEAGRMQVEESCRLLQSRGITITVVKYSLAANCMDTADIVGRELQIGRDRIVPEFTFMDPRAIGQWDNLPLTETEPAIWALDNDEAGPTGNGGRPPANDDSTPHETLADHGVRLRQLMSVLETQFSGDNILVVFPDGTGPALLTAMIGGIPLNRVHELNLNPGEINFDVTMDNSLKRLPLESTPEYLEVIKTGREQLQILRSTSADKIVNVNDRRYEAERRLVLEKQAKLVEDRGQAKKLQEARRFDEKKRRMERKTTSEVAENEKIMSVLSQTLLGGTLGILGLTGAASFTSRSKEFREDIHNFSSERVKSDVIGDADKSPVEIRNDRSAFGIGEERNLTQISNGELSENEDSLDDVAEAIAAGELHRSLLLNVKDKEDREMIAASAMQDYLNQDDGGEDWLGVISNIIQDDNGDDCDEEAFQ